LELKWEQEHVDHDRYTLNMVRIDDKIREVITEIKLEEAKVKLEQEKTKLAQMKRDIKLKEIDFVEKVQGRNNGGKENVKISGEKRPII
jgi:hypothetical protein